MKEFKIVSGSFVDGVACDVPSQNWVEADWARQFDVMKAMGMDTVIIIRIGWGMPCADSAMYKSDVLRTTLYEEPDLVELLFRQADRVGLKMYLGLFDSETHWVRNDWDAEVDMNKRLLDEMWPRYGAHPSFHGWYLSHEGSMEYHQTKIWKPLAKRMREFDPTKRIMISPRYAGSKWAKDHAVTPQQHQKHFDYIFSELEGLVHEAAFMDGHVNFSELERYVAATHEVCAKHGVSFWSNLETFDRDMPWRFPPIEWIKMKHKLEVVQPYVEKIITFEAPHFLSPYSMYPSAKGLCHRYLTDLRRRGVEVSADAWREVV